MQGSEKMKAFHMREEKKAVEETSTLPGYKFVCTRGSKMLNSPFNDFNLELMRHYLLLKGINSFLTASLIVQLSTPYMNIGKTKPCTSFILVFFFNFSVCPNYFKNIFRSICMRLLICGSLFPWLLIG